MRADQHLFYWYLGSEGLCGIPRLPLHAESEISIMAYELDQY